MVTLLIQSEMGLPDFDTAEDVKKYPLAKVESLFHIRHENGTVEFFQQPLDPNLFAKVVILKEGKLLPLEGTGAWRRSGSSGSRPSRRCSSPTRSGP